MSKKDIKGIAREAFDKALAEVLSTEGLKDLLVVTDKAAWTQITGKSSGHRVYVSKAKVVKQVDFSGFGAELRGTRAPSKPNGKVQAQLDIDKADAIERFQTSLVHLASLPAEVKAAKKREPSADKAPVRTIETTEDAEAARKARIAKYMAEKGLA